MRIMQQWLTRLDAWICRYAGLEASVASPSQVRWVDDGLVVMQTESCKRHLVPSAWQQFAAADLTGLSVESKSQLGQAVGQSIAKGLVVSFDAAKES